MKVLIHREYISVHNFGTAKDVLEGVWDTLIPQRIYEYCDKNKIKLSYQYEEHPWDGIVFIDFYAEVTEQQATYINLLK